MITVNFFNALETILNTKQIRVYADEIPVLDLLKACEMQASQPFLAHILNDHEHLLPATTILVNGQNVRQLHGVETIVRNGSDVVIFSKP